MGPPKEVAAPCVFTFLRHRISDLRRLNILDRNASLEINGLVVGADQPNCAADRPVESTKPELALSRSEVLGLLFERRFPLGLIVDSSA